MKIQIFKRTHSCPTGNKVRWYFRIRARNGKIVAQSEGYISKRNTERAIAALIAGVPAAPIEVIDGKT